MNKSVHFKFFLVIFSVLSVFFSMFSLFSLFVVSASLFSNNKTENKEKEGFSNNHEYQFFQRDLKTKQTSIGIVVHPGELEESKFIFEEINEDKMILISHFGDEEFECVGSCYCEKDPNSRRSSTPSFALEGIRFLLVATTSLLAYELASDYFEEKCSREMIDKCQQDEIVSINVDECYSLMSSHSESSSKNVMDGSIDQNIARVYFCKGHCVSKKFSTPQKMKLLKLLKEERQKNPWIICENIIAEGEVKLTEKFVERFSFTELHERARGIFRRDYLTGLCRKSISVKMVPKLIDGKIKNEIEIFEGKHKLYYGFVLCKSSYEGSYQLKNVKCRQVWKKQ